MNPDSQQPPPNTETGLRRELLAILVLYLAVAILPLLFGLLFAQ